MESREARIGTSVGALDATKRAGKVRVGTIVRTYGHPDHLAVDVHFEDGSVELYWYHELRTAERRPSPEEPRPRVAQASPGSRAVVMTATKEP